MQFRTISIVVLVSAPCVQCMQLSFDQASISDPYEGAGSSSGISATLGITGAADTTAQSTSGDPSGSGTNGADSETTQGADSGTTQGATASGTSTGSSSTDPMGTTTQTMDSSSSTSGEPDTSGESLGVPCENTKCGDGCVGGDEVCDPKFDAACGDDCKVICGNGIPEAGEDCDDGDDYNALDGVDDGCFKCKETRLAFVTSMTTPGSITAIKEGVLHGGIDAADIICADAALAQDLDGEYRAWLSYRGVIDDVLGVDHPAKDNILLDDYLGVYILPNGIEIASSGANLKQGQLKNPLNIDEGGTMRVGFAWTNTKYNGLTSKAEYDCRSWGGIDLDWPYGLVGDISQTDMKWTFISDDDNDDGKNGDDPDLRGCDEAHHLYCFQVKIF